MWIKGQLHLQISVNKSENKLIKKESDDANVHTHTHTQSRSQHIFTFAFLWRNLVRTCVCSPRRGFQLTRIIHLWQFSFDSVPISITATWFTFRHSWTFTELVGWHFYLTVWASWALSKLYKVHTSTGISKLSITHRLQMSIANGMNERNQILEYHSEIV